MGISSTLVEVGANRLRYLIVFAGEGSQAVPDFTTTGAASPDLLTDSIYGPIKQIANAFVNGLGLLPAGAMTQAQARAMWMADSSDAILGNNKIARAIPRLTYRSQFGGTAPVLTVDATVDGAGHPVIRVTSNVSNLGFSAYLDIQTQGEIGL